MRAVLGDGKWSEESGHGLECQKATLTALDAYGDIQSRLDCALKELASTANRSTVWLPVPGSCFQLFRAGCRELGALEMLTEHAFTSADTGGRRQNSLSRRRQPSAEHLQIELIDRDFAHDRREHEPCAGVVILVLPVRPSRRAGMLTLETPTPLEDGALVDALALDRHPMEGHRCAAGMRPRLPTRSPRRRASTTQRLPSWLRCLVQIARLLIIACTLQLSSASHVLVDLVSGAGALCIDACGCSEERGADEHGCPSDCGDCACPHGRLPSLPPEIAAAVPSPLAWELHAPWSPYESGAPPSPPLSSFERPPRA